MKGGKLPQGFTIFEVMIVLAISGLMLAVAINAVSGYQTKAEFTQAIRDIETQLTDIANDVNNGYFPSYSNINCTVNGSNEPSIAPGTNSQGTNQNCIFIGKAVQFNKNSIDIYTLVGNKFVSPNVEATSLDQVKVYTDTTLKESRNLLFGIEPNRISADVGTGGSVWNTGVKGSDTGAPPSARPSTVMFITSFGEDVGGGNLVGSPVTNLYVLKNSRSDTPGTIAGLLTTKSPEITMPNPYDPKTPDPNQYYFPISGGYTVCFVRDNSQAAISLGVHDSRLTVRTTIGSC